MCRYGNRKYEVFGEKEVAMPNIAFLKRSEERHQDYKRQIFNTERTASSTITRK